MIVVGTMVLLRELDVIGSIRWDIFWPLVIVGIGLAILLPQIISSRR